MKHKLLLLKSYMRQDKLFFFKYFNIHIGGEYGLGIHYIPCWDFRITFLFITINFHKAYNAEQIRMNRLIRE